MEGLLQPTHLILILVIALLVFGPRTLPELGQGLGNGIRGFRDALRGISEDSGSAGARAPVPAHATSTSPSTPAKKAAKAPLH